MDDKERDIKGEKARDGQEQVNPSIEDWSGDQNPGFVRISVLIIASVVTMYFLVERLFVYFPQDIIKGAPSEEGAFTRACKVSGVQTLGLIANYGAGLACLSGVLMLRQLYKTGKIVVNWKRFMWFMVFNAGLGIIQSEFRESMI